MSQLPIIAEPSPDITPVKPRPKPFHRMMLGEFDTSAYPYKYKPIPTSTDDRRPLESHLPLTVPNDWPDSTGCGGTWLHYTQAESRQCGFLPGGTESSLLGGLTFLRIRGRIGRNTLFGIFPQRWGGLDAGWEHDTAACDRTRFECYGAVLLEQPSATGILATMRATVRAESGGAEFTARGLRNVEIYDVIPAYHVRVSADRDGDSVAQDFTGSWKANGHRLNEPRGTLVGSRQIAVPLGILIGQRGKMLRLHVAISQVPRAGDPAIFPYIAEYDETVNCEQRAFSHHPDWGQVGQHADTHSTTIHPPGEGLIEMEILYDPAFVLLYTNSTPYPPMPLGALTVRIVDAELV